MHPGESHAAVGNRAFGLRTEATAHPRSAELAQARNNDRLGSVGGLRARVPVIHAWGVCAAHRALATPTERRLLPPSGLAVARQHVRTSCHEPREAVHRGGCNAQRRAAPFWPVTNGSECRPHWQPGPPAAAGACGMRAFPCKYVHFGAKPRPRAYTPGAMVARAWSDLMCLETH